MNLTSMQEEGGTMLTEEVTDQDVAEVVAKWTGIPVSRLLEGEVQKLIRWNAPPRARDRPDEAISASQSLRRSRAGLSDPDRPIGSFLFLGPTVSARTELAKGTGRYVRLEQAIIRSTCRVHGGTRSPG
jgi:ATP-dependent Clp protease ATP-binding subunit ClpB